ncbi:3-deoxy-manno-octulosonate cytidylyltransferase [Planctomycetales bacterium]|nr:3-deoxy-manno-octulosonate cytidylyltransferase [Planctomycetales bacterium]GHT02838.1 3-deoxy-manno-octulosonate cytidylyltransferase [Planctomycetales bacterium]
MSVLLVIPARYESTRLPRKLLLAETGKPLICHTLDAATAVCRRSVRFSGVLVATDHVEILQAVNDYAARQNLPARAVMTSPNHQSGTDRVAEAAFAADDADVIINWQGDEPEMDAAAIVELAEKMLAEREIPLATLGYPLSAAAAANPNVVKIVIGAAGGALYFSRAAIPFDRDGKLTDGAPYLGHCGIYAYRRDVLRQLVGLPPSRLEQIERLEQLRALENGIAIYVHRLDRSPAKGIDTADDYREFVARCG